MSENFRANVLKGWYSFIFSNFHRGFILTNRKILKTTVLSIVSVPFILEEEVRGGKNNYKSKLSGRG